MRFGELQILHIKASSTYNLRVSSTLSAYLRN